LQNIPEGKYTIHFELEGFSPTEREIYIRPAQTGDIKVNLEREIPLPPPLPNP
jgi:hypothetical protein